jgi:manganese/iron transport system permease protein/iron/zinc/copper transport system permease protein
VGAVAVIFLQSRPLLFTTFDPEVASASGLNEARIDALLMVVLQHRALLFTTFDPEVAEVSGVRVARIDALLMMLLSFAILASMKVLGVTLIAAAVVIPATTARMLTDSFARMLWLATVVGALAGLAGMYVSYHLDISSGATIVLVNFAAFAGVFAATGTRHGVKART